MAVNYRDKFKEEYIKDNNLPNGKIISYKDKDYFDYYKLNDIPKGSGLADCARLDKDGNLEFGFLKGADKDEMKLIIGYTGSGKSLRYLLPQLIVATKAGHSSIVTDMSGQLLDYSYDFLKKNGVNVKILNFTDTKISDTYNPFYFEALKCVEKKEITQSTIDLIENISRLIIHTQSTKEPTWDMGARSLFKGIIYGMFEELIEGNINPEDVTFYNIIQQYFWMRNGIVKHERMCELKDIGYYSIKDEMSASIQNLAPFAESAPVTRSGYFSVVADNINEINSTFVFDLTSSNTIDLSELWTKQTVLFINTGGREYGDIITSLLVEQLYNQALDESMKRIDRKLPKTIHLFLDEFANVSFGDNKHFEKMITTTRKMQIYFNMFIQNYTQIETKFGVAGANTITSNSTEVFLGTKDYHSREIFAASCGKKTIEGIDSLYYSNEPRLYPVALVTPEQLLKTQKGTMYVNRNGFETFETYFEAAYNCKEFSPSKNYENDYKDQRYDYQNNLVLQPYMNKNRNFKKMSGDDLEAFLTEDVLDEFLKLVENDVITDSKKINKFVKMGLLKVEQNGVITPVFSKTKIASIRKDLNKDIFKW